jgi:hypothetical protein
MEGKVTLVAPIRFVAVAMLRERIHAKRITTVPETLRVTTVR